MIFGDKPRPAQSRFPVAALALVAALLLAPTAAAEIVPQQGIAGVKLKMTRAQVVAAKGKPDAEKVVRSEIVGRQRMMRYGATKLYFGGTATGVGVLTVRTTDPDERTRSGVGIGSTATEVMAGVPGTSCRTEFGFHHCWRGSFLPGARVTDFIFDRPGGEVASVTVGFVVD